MAPQDAETPGGQIRYFLTDEQLASCRYKLAKRIMLQLERLCLMDPDNLHQVIMYRIARWFRGAARTRARRRVSFEGIDDQRPKAAPHIRRVWPLLLLLVYLALTVNFVYLFVLQFRYDRYSLKVDLYESKRLLNDSRGFNTSDPATAGELLEAKLGGYKQLRASTWERIKLLGHPYVNLRFTWQAFGLVGLAMTFLLYLLPQLIGNYFGFREALFLANLTLNERAEFESCAAIIGQSTAELLNSSANYLKFSKQMGLETLELGSHRAQTTSVEARQAPGGPLIASGAGATPIAQLRAQHQMLAGFVRQMAAGRELLPPNRAGDWVLPMLDEYLKVCATNLLYSCTADFFFVYGLFKLLGYQLDIVTPADRFHFVEEAIYFLLGILPTCNYVDLTVPQNENQARYIDLIRREVHACIHLGDFEFVQLKAMLGNIERSRGDAAKIDCDSTIGAMNRRLVGVFLKYRILIAQLVPLRRLWSAVVVVMLTCMFVSPVFMRLYTPYVAGASGNIILIVYSFTLIGFTNLTLLPICIVHRQGQTLYKALHSLAAHAIDLNQQWRELLIGVQLPAGETIPTALYMDHMVWLLRKELAYSDEVLARFSTQAFGFQATFPNVVEMQFYFSILIMSLFFEISSWRKLLGDRLDDPFQILGP